jgi:hypothetical protein
MKTFLLLFGLFWVGFYFAELIGAIAKRPIPVFANIVLGFAFPAIAYYFL